VFHSRDRNLNNTDVTEEVMFVYLLLYLSVIAQKGYERILVNFARVKCVKGMNNSGFLDPVHDYIDSQEN